MTIQTFLMNLSNCFIVHKICMLCVIFLFNLCSISAMGLDVAATLKALKMRNAITGGMMPVTDPVFIEMVANIERNDLLSAANLAVKHKHFANYLARRLALQMQTPALDSAGITDSDASTFLIAHFIGAAGTSPRISTIWSENADYLVQLPNGSVVHAASLNATQLATVDWNNLVRTGGQQVTGGAYIPVKHVGGYTTLSDRPRDNSFAMFGATAGTNLRMIEGIWEIATGLNLMDVASERSTPQLVPRFVPEFDPNFFHGSGQPACVSCHGGGFSSINHGYATVANVFDFTNNGFTFIANPTTGTMKSLGSDPGQRRNNQVCNLTRTPTPVCNPESPDVDPQQGWDLTPVWPNTGVLKKMGWQGALKGRGLQELGYAIGSSWIVYQYFTQRVIGELCPLGTFSTDEINRIAALANPWAEPAGSDDIRTIVANVAANPGCF